MSVKQVCPNYKSVLALLQRIKPSDMYRSPWFTQWVSGLFFIFVLLFSIWSFIRALTTLLPPSWRLWLSLLMFVCLSTKLTIYETCCHGVAWATEEQFHFGADTVHVMSPWNEVLLFLARLGIWHEIHIKFQQMTKVWDKT